jgi:transcription elongation factor Elf1
MSAKHGHHLEPRHDQFECVFCEATFPSKSSLKSHLERLHTKGSDDDGQVQCCVCSLRFDSDIVLVLHLRTVHSMQAKAAKDLVDEQTGKNRNPIQLECQVARSFKNFSPCQ